MAIVTAQGRNIVTLQSTMKYPTKLMSLVMQNEN